jgi:hypothetical protein
MIHHCHAMGRASKGKTDLVGQVGSEVGLPGKRSLLQIELRKVG